MILRHLAAKDQETFSRLLESTRATPRMLTRTLRHLVSAKLVDYDEWTGGYAINTNGGKGLLVLEQADALDPVSEVGAQSGVAISNSQQVEATWKRPASWDE